MPRRSKQQPKGLARGGVVQVEGQMIRRVKTVAFHADWIGRLGMTERGKRRAGGGEGNGGGGEGCGLGVYGYGYWILDGYQGGGKDETETDDRKVRGREMMIERVSVEVGFRKR